MKKKKSIKRETTEWIILLGIIAVLYTTGWYVPVMGFVQGLVLKTGLIKPNTGMHDAEKADYNFTLIDESGNEVPFSEFKAQTVFLNFWATWCPPCIAEMPDINDLFQNMQKNNVRFVLVSEDDDFEKAKRFKEKKGFDFPIYQLNGSLPRVFFSRSIPTTFVVSPQGQVVMKHASMAKYNTTEFRDFPAFPG